MSERFWSSVGDAVDRGRPAAPADAVADMLRRAAGQPEPVPPRRGVVRHARFAWQLVVAQVRLVRTSVWTASVLLMGLGVVLGARPPGAEWPAAVLAMVAPLVAAAGIAGVCGAERDPGLEFLAATETSPRVVLLARVTVVFSYDFVLAVAASVVLAAVGVDPPALTALIGAWLGPMTLLSAVSLLLSVWIGTTTAVAVALTLWLARLLAPALATDTGWLVPVARSVEELWSTTVSTGVLAAVFLAAAVALAGRSAGRSPVR